MKYLTSQTVGMSGSVYLSSASTGQEIKRVPVAGPEPRAWGTSSWARAVPLACQVIPGALGHRRGIEGAIHVGGGSVGSHCNRLIGSKVTKSTYDSGTLCPFSSQSHSC